MLVDEVNPAELARAPRPTVERLRAVREATLDATFVLRAVRDDAGRLLDLEILDVNRRGAERLQGTRESVIGRRLSELYPRWIDDGLRDDAVRALENGVSFETDATAHLGHGPTRWTRRQYLPIGADELSVASRDVTAERALERAFLRDFDRLQTMVALQAELMTQDADPERLIEIVVARAKELCRATGAKFERCERDLLATEGARIEVDGDGVSTIAVPLVHERRVHGVLEVVSSDANAFDAGDVAALQILAGFVAAVLQRAHARASHEAAGEARNRLAAIVESSRDPIYEIDLEGRIVSWNPSAESVLGWSRAQMIGRKFVEIFPADADAEPRRLFRRCVQGEAVTSFETTILRRDGTPLDVSATWSPVLDARGRICAVAVIARDIGAQKRLHRDLAHAQRMSALGTMTAGVAHEINSPLTATSANVGFALEQIRAVLADPPADGSLVVRTLDDIRVALEDAGRGAERVAGIVRDMRTLAGSEGTARADVALGSIVDATIRSVRARIDARVGITSELGDAPKVRADVRELGRALENLLVNAAQAVERCTQERRQIRVVLGRATNGDALLEIVDRGVGMSSETVARVFEPFFTTRDVGRGTGLGLAVVHAVVAAHGGNVTVESALGHGTTMRVRLPAAPTIAEMPEKRARMARVLVIDDEPMIGLAIKRSLARDAEVVFADGADAAQRLIEGEPDDAFDLVLCDVMMPGKSGIEFFTSLRETHPSVAERCVFITGGALNDQARTFLSSMVERVVSKPFRAEELRRLLARRI